jgi:ubiquinone/menaquinone biosynthesis C-methylase UbiE
MKIRDSGMPDEAMWSGFYDPFDILEKLGLADVGTQSCDTHSDPSMPTIVDMGCGYGTFTIPAAQMTEGTIIAFDIETGMLEVCQDKAQELNLSNITFTHRDFMAEGTGLDNDSVEFVMLFNILHTEYPVRLLEEAFRILRSHCNVAIIHWIYDPGTPRGPEMSIRPKPEQCVKWLQQAGFTVPQPIIDLPPYHYGIIGIK